MSFFKSGKTSNTICTLLKTTKSNLKLSFNFQSVGKCSSFLKRNFSYSSDPNYSVKNKYKIISMKSL